MKVIKDDYISKIEVVRILQKAYAEGRIKAKDGLSSVLDDIQNADIKPVTTPTYSWDEYAYKHMFEKDGATNG